MRVLSAMAYYAASLPQVLTGFERPLRACATLLGLVGPPHEVGIRPTGLRFRIRDAMDLWVLKETCLDDVYLPDPVRPEPDWTVLDIGGGIGDFAVWMASRCPEGVVHSYEPMAGASSLLQENVALNGIENVVAHRAAVAARECEGALRLSPGQPPVLARFVEGGEGEACVVARGLASALAALPGAGCDLMKVDCEGGEFDLLLDADPSLLERVRRISLEYHDGVAAHRGTDLARHLASCGYRVHLSRNPVHRHLGHLYAERVTDAADEGGASVMDGPE